MNTKTITVLGIDPGLDRTGWAILTRDARSVLSLCACGLIHTGKELALPERLEYIFKEITHLLQTYHPDQVGMEQNFFMKHTTTMAHTTQTRGVITLACQLEKRTISFYQPKRVKMMLCGSGAADKKQVQRMVQLTLNLDKKPEPDDVADAVAIAICHLKTSPLNNLLNVQTAFAEKIKAARLAQAALIKKLKK